MEPSSGMPIVRPGEAGREVSRHVINIYEKAYQVPKFSNSFFSEMTFGTVTPSATMSEVTRAASKWMHLL